MRFGPGEEGALYARSFLEGFTLTKARPKGAPTRDQPGARRRRLEEGGGGGHGLRLLTAAPRRVATAAH